jgi:uncharacterized membrane protein
MSDNLVPLEYVVIKFSGNKFKGEIAPEIYRLIEEGFVRIVDVVFVSKDKDGHFTVLELNDLSDEEYSQFAPLTEHLDPLFTGEDVSSLAAHVPPDTSALVLLWQDIWSEKLRRAIANADGQLVVRERIPAEVLNEVMDEIAAKKQQVTQ